MNGKRVKAKTHGKKQCRMLLLVTAFRRLVPRAATCFRSARFSRLRSLARFARLRASLVRVCPYLAVSGRICSPGGVLDSSWGVLGCLGGVLDASWRRLGGVVGASWTSWRRLGSVLEMSWRPLGRPWAEKGGLCPKRKQRNIKKLYSAML